MLFAPRGRVYRFVREVVATWLSPYDIEPALRLVYRGPVQKFGFVLGGGERPGFGTLGHSTFFCQPDEADLPTPEECQKCLDTDSLLQRFL
jgi:hypothetical protein